MGRASISIAITSNFNSRGIDAAIRKAEQLAASAVHYQGQFGKAAVDMGASMGQAAARLTSMGKAVADLGDRLTVGVTIPMGLAATAAIASAAKIDTAWYNVRKTVDMTEEGYARLKEGAMALSEVQPVSAETILNIEALGGQLGIANDYLEDFAKIVSGLDISTNMDSQTAAQELAQFRNIVQMSEDDLDNFASTLVDLGNHTATTEADMMNLALRFASAGHIAGMSNQDILGLSAALSGLGMKAEAGGSAISRTINDINNSVATGGEKLQKWADLVGKTPEQFTQAWRSAPMEEFIDVLTHIGDAGEDMGVILEELGITQIRQSDAMRRLASSGDLVTESVQRANQAWRENTALQREVDNRNESLQARWDTLVNRFTNDLARIGEPIAQMGLDVIEGLEPAIQGVGDLAQAFANADPAVQRFAFNLAAVAMSAGPVLSVAGRLMQAVGNMGTRVGRVTQQWGVYQEAMRTTDVSMLNTLSNNQSLAASFGASRNAIVKAAGGLDRYNLAYAKTTDAIRKNVEEQVRSTSYQIAFNDAIADGAHTEEEAAVIADKAAHSRETNATVTRKQKQAINELNSSIDASNVKTKLNTDAIGDQEVAAAKASRTFGKMGDALKGALIGFGVSAAIGGVIALITWLATSMQEAAEHADLMDRATNGLRDSLHGMGDAAEGASGAQRDLVGSIRDTHEAVQRAIENQAELAEKFAEADRQAAVQMGTLDKSADIIEKYANKGGIGVAQLQLLKGAIDDVNQACGQQYQVLEDGTIVIEGETGAIQVNTDEILRNIDARKRQIQVEATESKYQSAYENLVDQTYARAEAQTKLNKAQERYNELRSLSRPLTSAELDEYNALGVEIPKLEQELSDLDETRKEAAHTEQYWASLLESQGEKLQNLSQGMQDLLGPTSMFTAYFAAAEKDVVAFAAACEQAGINWQFLNSLTETEIQELADNFDGSMASIIESLEELGKTQALEDLASNWREKVDEGTYALAEGIANAHDVSVARLAAMAADLGLEGEEAINRFLEGIELGLSRGLDLDQASELGRRIAEEFREGLSPEQADQLMTEFMNNLARGMGSKAALDAAIQKLKQSLSQVDFTFEGQQAASTWLAGFNSGGGSGVNIDQFKQNLYDHLDTVNNTVNEKGEVTGEGWPLKVAEGIDSNAGAVDSSLQGLVDGVGPVLEGGAPVAAGAGSQTVQGYIDSILAQGGAAEGAAFQTLGRLLQIWLLGIESARQAGQRTGQAYGEGAQSGFSGTQAAATQAVQAVLQALQSGVAPATAAGSQTGQGYGRTLSQLLVNAVTLSRIAVNQITLALRNGVAPAQQAGRETGNGYGRALGESAYKAVGLARTISLSTGSAFGAGKSSAAAAGDSLGAAFASAVWRQGSIAIAYARSTRNTVKDIFDNIPTANIKVNVTRTVTTTTASPPSSFGGHALRYAALPSPTPVIPVPTAASTARAAEVADRAIRTIAGSGSRQSPSGSLAGAVTAAVTSETRAQGPAVDYQTMYRVVRSGVRAAIEESGGLAPVVELDGRAVSRQLAPHMDRELGRLDRQRG